MPARTGARRTPCFPDLSFMPRTALSPPPPRRYCAVSTRFSRGGLHMPQSDENALDSRHGWRVVGGAHVVTAITFGSAYAFSALFPGLSAEFDASRGEVALVFSIAAFIFYSLGAIAGPLADRWSTRRLVAAGLIAMAAGYVVAGRATSLPGLYIAYGVGVGVGIGLSYV